MSESHEELLRKAKRLKQQTETAQKRRRREHKFSIFGRTQKQISDIHETARNTGGTIMWLYDHVAEPVITHPLSGAPFRWYKKLWTAYVYVKDQDGDESFSKQRAGTMVLATMVFLSMLPSILSVTAELIWDTSRMALSYRENEVLYLGKSQEIDPAGNVFSAQGCESIRCTDQTSIYFRIKPSLAHHIWSLNHNGNMFFPDFVAGGIQNDVNRCLVTNYGARWKFLVRNWDIYPQILSVDCSPVTEAEIEQAAEDNPLAAP
ncbi:MAG: hypothetical protein H6867_11705 [Rhodospirillales bacterium]|nr:hypothetical protein [Rhodospirillales bacterium]